MTDQDFDQIRALIREGLDSAVVSIGSDCSKLRAEMGAHFGEVTECLDRMDATLARLGKQVIAGFTEWTTKADAD
jgi:hypothetical protein